MRHLCKAHKKPKTNKVQWNEDVSHMFDEELGQAVWISQTFLQLPQEVAAMETRDGGPVVEQMGDIVTCQK